MTAQHSKATRLPEVQTFAELARIGHSPGDIERLLRTGELKRVRNGYYVRAAAEVSGTSVYEQARQGFLARTRAAARATDPGTVISHGSALALHGLPLYDIPLDRPTVTRHRPGGGSRRSSVLTCWNHPISGATTVVDGIEVTTPARTIIDVARTHGLPAGVCAADEALRRGLCTRKELVRHAGEARGQTGAARARALPELVSGLAESVLESLVRLHLVQCGIQVPDLQIVIAVANDERFRVDFYWRSWRLIGEADGWGKYGSTPEEIRRNQMAERRRQRLLEEAGYAVIRWTWEDLRSPERMAACVAEAMRRQELLGWGPEASHAA